MVRYWSYIFSSFLFCCTSVVGSIRSGLLSGYVSENQRPQAFALISPAKDTVVTMGSIVFTWENRGDPDPPDFRVHHYRITFSSRRRRDEKTFTVLPEDSLERRVSLKFDDCRKVFRRHGKYYWRVTAFDADGNRTDSDVWSFVVGISKDHGGFVSWIYPYGIQFQVTRRLESPEYRAFLENVDSKSQLQSFFDFGLIFHQQGFLIPHLELQEKFLILSQMGLGFEISSRVRILRSLYFTLYPQGGVRSCWFAKGLKDYSSTQYSTRFGCDLVIMPRGYVSFRGSWVPDYRVRYSEKGGELRTFMGEGWELGVRLVIPHGVLNTFRFLGMEFDFQRIPFEFHFSRIRDEYSGTVMRMQRFGIAYLLQ